MKSVISFPTFSYTRADSINNPETTSQLYTPYTHEAQHPPEPMMSKPRYHLLIEADGARPEGDQIRKLRALLKRLGRTYGIRCLSIRPADQPAPKQENRR